MKGGIKYKLKVCEKIKLIRKANNLTQSEFAEAIGISRGNLANIEIGKVTPTQLFINCVALTYNINKSWIIDENNNDLNELNGPSNLIKSIVDNYEKLDDKYKKFVENQIIQLLDLQKNS